MIVLLVALARVAFGVPETPKAEPIPPPQVEVKEGLYTGVGRMPDGTPYKGVVLTLRKVGKGYRMQWNVETHQPALGIAMLRGGHLIVAMGEVGALASVLRYKVNGDELTGEWMLPDGSVGEETLTFVKAFE